MGTGYRGFEMPKQLVCDESSYTNTYGKFVAEPFERGYGITLANSLRRVLISSIEGAAVATVKIDGVLHEFSSLQGVKEDVVEIILNLKKLIIRSHSRQPKTIYLKASRKGEVRAKDIETDETVEILNPDLLIATLTSNAKFGIEMEVQKGRGYVPSERNKKEGQAIGVIAVDSIFSPVSKVNFSVENTRVGQITDFDKVILEIWTNGVVSPKDALLYASNILQRHLDVFVNFGKLPEEEEEIKQTEEEKALTEKMNMPVTELELSVRSSNCLKEAKIKSIGELIKKSETEMLKYRNFGKKSLAEISKVLQGMGLSLGMKIDSSAEEK